jgi:hypothetical protein
MQHDDGFSLFLCCTQEIPYDRIYTPTIVGLDTVLRPSHTLLIEVELDWHRVRLRRQSLNDIPSFAHGRRE